MHDRYFYLADAVSIIYAFYFTYYWYTALIEQICSFLSYTPFLSNLQGVSLSHLTYEAFGVLFLIVITLADLVKTLFPTMDGSAATPSVSTRRSPS
jgi:hypothetical protein